MYYYYNYIIFLYILTVLKRYFDRGKKRGEERRRGKKRRRGEERLIDWSGSGSPPPRPTAGLPDWTRKIRPNLATPYSTRPAPSRPPWLVHGKYCFTCEPECHSFRVARLAQSSLTKSGDNPAISAGIFEPIWQPCSPPRPPAGVRVARLAGFPSLQLRSP